MRFIIIVGGIVFSVVAMSRLLRRKRSGPMRRARKEMQRAVEDIDTAVADLASKAKKRSGEVKENLECQIRALEDRRQDLMGRLEAGAEELVKGAKKAKEAALA